MTTRSSTRFRAPQVRPGPTFAQARAQMRAGAALHLTYIEGRPTWELNDHGVAPEVVSLLLACSEIIAADDVLFPGEPSQTWKARR
jgi:hypothetical protein